MLNRLKAAYVSVYLTVIAIIMIYSAGKLIDGESMIGWGGALLTSAPMALLFTFMLIRPIIARTSENLTEIHVPTALGTLFAAGDALSGNDALPLILALISYAGFLLYVFWYSRYDREESQAITVGKPLPDVMLQDADGQDISLQTLTSQPTVLLFFRGNWCPLCMAQIKEIAAQYREIEALGAQVVLVSPQPQGHTRSLAKKFDVNFRFMTDSGNKVADALGIVSDFGIPTGFEALGYDTEAPMPTVIITNAEGQVVWADQTDNYRVRPEPATFIGVLQAL